MGNKFKDAVCVYCAKLPGITDDHIFCREFFLKGPARDNLPQAPACEGCNNRKAKLEHYLTSVLPFGGTHPDALDNLETLVPGRLAKNQKLHRQLSQEPYDGKVPLEGEKIEALFDLIARALIWHHWKLYLNETIHAVHAATITSQSAEAFKAVLSNFKSAAHVKEILGNKSFLYEGLQGVDDSLLTVWRFLIYGGLVVEAEDGPPFQSEIIVFTGSHNLINKLAASL